jgi:hypothetical protein
MGANAVQFTDITALYGGAANILDVRNGTNATVTRFFNKFTSTTNYESFNIDWQTTADTLITQTQKGASGTARTWQLRYGGVTSHAIDIPIATTSSLELANVTPSTNTTGLVRVGGGGSSTSTSGILLGLNVSFLASPTSTSTLAVVGLNIANTLNYSNGTPGAGTYKGINVALTETANPTGSILLMQLNAGVAGTTQEVAITNGGELYFRGVSEDTSTAVLCVKSDKNVGTCSSVVGAGGTCTCG